MNNYSISTVYINKKGNKYIINCNENGSLEIFQKDWDGKERRIFKASSGWTRTQAEKWCEL
jgi:hypothetical protein